MSKGIWLINGACCVLLLAGSLKISKDWEVFAAAHQPGLLKKSSAPVVVKGAVASAAPVPEVWTDILTRNPFSFDRNDIDIPPAAPEAPRPVPPKPVVFGIVDLGSGRRAMLGDPGARRSSQAVKVGEQFKGWTVVRIEERSVVMETDGVETSIVMGNAPIDRDAGKTSVATSTPSVSSTATAAPAPVPASAPVSPAAAPAGTKMIVTPFGNFPEQTP